MSSFWCGMVNLSHICASSDANGRLADAGLFDYQAGAHSFCGIGFGIEIAMSLVK